MAKTTLFELKEKMTTLQAAIAADAEWIAEKAANPETPMEEINKKKAHRDELQARYELLKAEHDAMEAEQRASVRALDGNGGQEAADQIKIKAAFYRAALLNAKTGNAKTYEGLGGTPAADADLGYGSNLLPKNVSTELITEPVEENSLRQVEPVTQVTGLEEPKLLFTIEDTDLADVTDKDTAKEIELTGGTVTYGRFKTKIFATVKDTVLYGTDTDLVSTVEGGLRSGLAVKEKMRAFALPAAYDSDHKHMSFYAADDGVPQIKEVAGPNLIQAVINAWADLPEAFATNAKCVMRKSDYYAAIQTLKGDGDLWGKKPEDVIGIPVIFNDRAVIPVIGDFRYSKQNYDIETLYDTDKDVKKGEYYFVLTAWGDHQIRLRSAFRLAVVGSADLKTLSIGAKTLNPTFDPDTLTYTCATTDSTNVITATAADENATVVIKNGTTTVNSGSAATWSAGANTVTITVTRANITKVYTVTVTKS